MHDSDVVNQQFAILDQMPVGAFVLRNNFTVVFWNMQLEEWTGIFRQEILGKEICAYFPHLDAPRYRLRIQAVFEYGIPFIFSPYLHKYVIPVEASKTQQQIQSTTVTRVPALDDAESYVLFSIQDVTELALRIKDYRLMRDQAQKEAKERQQAEKAAEAANRSKSEFLANMSHELRTPLNAILGYAQILKDDKNLEPRQIEALNTIKASGDHLLNMINEILDLAKIEAGRMELHCQEIYLPGFLNTLSEMIQVRAQQKGLAFHYQPEAGLPPGILADETRLREVLLNLLGNAVKFTQQGSVTLKIGTCRLKQSSIVRLQFSITDTGPGIAPQDLEQIFLPFHQAHEHPYTVEGTGLGLAISAKWVEMMGGSLQVESVPGGGSCFWFEIECPECQMLELQPKNHSQAITGYIGTRRRILVVDDKAANRAVLVNMLLPLGFEVCEAASGPECLKKAETFTPDMILLDLRMPGMDGFEVAQRIRQTDTLQNVVVIAVSASAFEEIQIRSRAAGCHDFLAKPFHRDDLLTLLQRFMQIEWIYDDSASKLSDDEGSLLLSPHIIRKLPAEIIRKLHKEILRGNVKGILEYLDTLDQYEETYRPIVQELKTLAKGFQVDTLLNIFESIAEYDETLSKEQ